MSTALTIVDSLITGIDKHMAEEKQSGPNVLICIADGSEDLEAVTIIDVLRRTKVLNVTVATVGGKSQITASRGTKIVGDCTIEEAAKQKTTFDMICLPGGMPGATNLGNDGTLKKMISAHQKNANFVVAAICAAPAVALAVNGVLKGVDATCYPVDKFKAILTGNGAQFRNDSVVIAKSGQSVIVTSQGPGTALEFSFVLVHLLLGFKAANQIAKAMLMLYSTKYSEQIKTLRSQLPSASR